MSFFCRFDGVAISDVRSTVNMQRSQTKNAFTGELTISFSGKFVILESNLKTFFL